MFPPASTRSTAIISRGGRQRPAVDFDATSYLDAYPEVRAAKTNPLMGKEGALSCAGLSAAAIAGTSGAMKVFIPSDAEDGARPNTH